ncbi:MAG: hypothetical protein J7539_07750 [Niabella sp.]|nr:hypothetical protein [Niabella sp.]
MERKFFLSILCISMLCHSRVCGQQFIRNLGFEDFDAFGRTIGWEGQDQKKKYNLKIDSIAHTGKYATLISSKPDAGAEKDTALFGSLIMNNVLKGKNTIRITAWIKTENLSDGSASLWIKLNGMRETIAEKNSDSQSTKGNSGWTKHTLEMPLTFNVQSIYFGCRMTGRGKAWFDDFEIFVDDAPVK